MVNRYAHTSLLYSSLVAQSIEVNLSKPVVQTPKLMLTELGMWCYVAIKPLTAVQLLLTTQHCNQISAVTYDIKVYYVLPRGMTQ